MSVQAIVDLDTAHGGLSLWGETKQHLPAGRQGKMQETATKLT